jgi:asparaginyl-tRNA synthetase
MTSETFFPPSLKQQHILYDQGCLKDEPIKTKFYGWIHRIRIGGGGSLIFIDIYDGSCIGSLMCIASEEYYQGEQYIQTPLDTKYELTDSDSFKTLQFSQLSKAEYLSDGCAVVIDGLMVKAPGEATQKFEFQIHRLRVIGGVEDPTTYPIQKSTEKHFTSLRQLPFMRIRSQVMQSIFRICSKAELGIHRFMDDHDVQKVDPNIITMSDCEGAGETFGITPLMFSRDSEGKDIPVGLTVSSQLPLESTICGLGRVYTAQKSFRAEKSDTIKHLAEFFHIEYEGAFHTLDSLMAFTEAMVKAVICYTHDRCKADFDFLESKFAPADTRSTRELLQLLLGYPFIRIKHCDAIDLIHKIVREKTLLPDDDGTMKRVKLQKLPLHGEDVGSEHEKLLVRYFGWIMLSKDARVKRLSEKKEFGAFVFLTHWPLKIKSFYMKQCDDGSGECESFDLLAPRVGEMFGGSMREWRYEKLDAEVKRRGMDLRPIQWFLDLRKSGSMPHGGWGMGFARFCVLLTGAPSVRDTVYLPVYYGHCPY